MNSKDIRCEKNDEIVIKPSAPTIEKRFQGKGKNK